MIVAEARSDDPDAGAVRERISLLVAKHRAPKPVDPDDLIPF